eukprot:3324663-Amphidinium_carterae.1
MKRLCHMVDNLQVPMLEQEEVVRDPTTPDPSNEMSAAATHEALALVNKSVGNTKGKELDPKQFDDAEWSEFLKTDYDQWMAH